MNTPAVTPLTGSNASVDLEATLYKQRRALLEEKFPSAEMRIDRISRGIDVLAKNSDRICEALSEDFGARAPVQTLVSDVLATINSMKNARKHVRKWMRPERRKTIFPLMITGAKAEIRFQPLGVIGIISPWNFPINLTFSPLGDALAAGNRVMIKPSDQTPVTSALIAEMVQEAYDENECAVTLGGMEVSQAFSALPFDHLLYTGGPEVAKHVMRAASDNLVPVTLELGGKCPVIIGKSADIGVAARRVMTTKVMNAGQICLAPDYVFVPEGKSEEFIEAARAALSSWFDDVLDNEDMTAVVNSRHHARLLGYVDEAKARQLRVEEFNPVNEDFTDPEKHKLPPTIIVEPKDDMAIMQEEVFGPLLSLKSYGAIDDVIDFINARPRPLALYYFGKDKNEEHRVLNETTSGGATVNDVAMHVAVDDLPFGGVGRSGMGAYHGRDGFLQFSHKKSVYRQGFLSLGKFFRPPYTEKMKRMIKKML